MDGTTMTDGDPTSVVGAVFTANISYDLDFDDIHRGYSEASRSNIFKENGNRSILQVAPQTPHHNAQQLLKKRQLQNFRNNLLKLRTEQHQQPTEHQTPQTASQSPLPVGTAQGASTSPNNSTIMARSLGRCYMCATVFHLLKAPADKSLWDDNMNIYCARCYARSIVCTALQSWVGLQSVYAAIDQFMYSDPNAVRRETDIKVAIALQALWCLLKSKKVSFLKGQTDFKTGGASWKAHLIWLKSLTIVDPTGLPLQDAQYWREKVVKDFFESFPATFVMTFFPGKMEIPGAEKMFFCGGYCGVCKNHIDLEDTEAEKETEAEKATASIPWDSWTDYDHWLNQ
ncbi:hypothetical protein QBC38DRAFT_238289 [Podospora fimiseda]|uniref:Uncharacterized protein n=1 Tax=Podospora fimiseda TaxID=252190 RepID=A0AAN7BML9_9PEZI|nr:hypothetical protein QBC38DRAFT_238289 [Podospora fimiseda]